MADAAAAPGARDLVGVRARVVETALRDLSGLDLNETMIAINFKICKFGMKKVYECKLLHLAFYPS